MSLKKHIQTQLAERTKARDEVGTNTLRMLLAGIKNREIELRAELEDKEILKVVQRQVKQRREAIEIFEQGGRTDLSNKERQELAILMSFMPEQLSEEAISQAVTKVIEELEAKDMKDMGRVMKAVMASLSGSADGKLVSDIVKKELSAQ